MSELRTNRIVPRDGLPAGSAGGVIQVVHQTRTTSFTTTNTAYQDFMSVSITPTRSDSKMLVRYGLYASTNGDVAHIYSSMFRNCLLYTSPSPRDRTRSRMPSSA